MFKNKFFINSLWLIIDKMYLLLGGFIVSIMVAKYLGPDSLGKFTYGIMLSLWCTTFSQWGASYYIFNMASKYRDKAIPYIKDSELHRTIIYFISWFLISLYLYFTLPLNDFLFISSLVLSGVFSGLDIYQYYFNGTLKSKYNARISIVARTISMSLRIMIVLYNGDLWLFIIPVFIEGIIVFFYKRSKVLGGRGYYEESDKGSVSCLYFKESFTFLMSTVLVLLFTKVNELVLQSVTDFYQLGVYTAAMTLSVAWTFLPLSVGMSLLSKVIENKKIESLTSINFFIISISIPVCIVFYFLSEFIVALTYGKEYRDINHIIVFTCLSSSLSVLNVINNRYIASINGGDVYLFKKLLFLAIISVIVTYAMVNAYGIKGAAYSLLVMEFFSYTLGNYLFSGANLFLMQFYMFKAKRVKAGFEGFK
ncbi:oligosaccharide flippase family protein [Aliivibrio fischeri]|uniref:oligosaccharide flippase family protein n=1 Tax=Aliivibrio fischeri TaxID=668 RepID=UPI0012D8E917|nr:oligosaccharide flippase family protein [Aliivibrio fischeri]MUK92265.1 oligosaccharide flippase family protein [Aliivibrio fischeri]